MSNKKILKDTRGMSLIETIVGATLLGITMFMAYSVFGSIFKAEATTKRSLSLIVARNNLVSHLLDAKTWINSTVATENTVLNCVAQQNQTDPVVRNCSGVTSAPINIYALDNTIAFNLQRTNIGFDWFGQACDTYQTPPSDGNPHCPVGFSVVAIPQCAASLTTCLNPSFVFQAQFAVNAGQATNPMNMAAFNFKIYEAGFKLSECQISSAG